MKVDISKFSWAELFSNSDGKTSATAFCGVIICVIGSLCFFMGCVDKMFINQSLDIITQSIAFVMIGATLLGVRKVVTKDDKVIDSNYSEETDENKPLD